MRWAYCRAIRFCLNQRKYWVELVRLYSNPEAGLKRLLKLLVRATSSRRTREQPTSRQAHVRLDHYQANALAAAYRDGKTINELADRYGIHRVTTVFIASTSRRRATPGWSVG